MTIPTTPSEPGTYVKIPVTVDAGLRIRSAPTTASDTVAIAPPGADLRVIEPVEVATPKLGVYNQWIHVRDAQGREGYVAAWYVEAGLTVPSVEAGGETGGAAEPALEPPVPSATEVEPTPEPVTIPEPPVPNEVEGKPEALTVYVSQSVGPTGLRLRKTASMGGALVAVEKAGTALSVLEPAKNARNKIGKKGKWIHVSDPKRLAGYVSAIYVELEAAAAVETPEPATEPEPVAASLTVYVSSAASAGLRMRDKPNTNSSTLTILPPGSELRLLEGTARMIGVYGKWLKVRETGGMEGYVAAWYVRK